MSDELRAAAEGVMESFNDLPQRAALRNTPIYRNAVKLAEAYLSEHPADDGEVVTKEWLRSIGFEPDSTRPTWGLEFGPVLVTFTGAVSLKVEICSCQDAALDVKISPTRSDVRRLCAALGIALMEKSSGI